MTAQILNESYPFTDLKAVQLNEFDDFLKRTIKKMDETVLTKPIILNVANPFLQQALFGIEALLDTKIHQLTLQNLLQVFDDGHQIAIDNSRLKAFNMLVTNNPLTQSAYNTEKKKPCSDLQEMVYRLYMLEFLVGVYNDLILQDNTTKSPIGYCVITGSPTFFDFQRIEFKINQVLSPKTVIGSGPTRNWIPLLGSFGSDAQALPTLSTHQIVSPIALFIYQYLPYTTAVYQGKLAVYQSLNRNFTRQFIKLQVKEYLAELRAKSITEKIEIRGKKVQEAEIMFNLLEQLYQYHEQHPSELINLNIWLFSNSGTSADASLIELPNKALDWIIDYVLKKGYKETMKQYLIQEQKSKYSYNERLIARLVQGKDYKGFYSVKKKNSIKTPLSMYVSYQMNIVGWNEKVLYQILQITDNINKYIDPNELSRILKENNSTKIRNMIQRTILKSIENKELDPVNAFYVFLLDPNLNKIEFNENYLKIFTFFLNENPDVIHEYANELKKQGMGLAINEFDQIITNTETRKWLSILNAFGELLVISNLQGLEVSEREEQKRKIFKGLITNSIATIQNMTLSLATKYPIMFNDYYVLTHLNKRLITRGRLSILLRLLLTMHFMGTPWWNDKAKLREISNEKRLESIKDNLHELSKQTHLPEKVLEEFHAYLLYRKRQVGIKRCLQELEQDLRALTYNQFKERIVSKEELSFTEYYWTKAGLSETMENEFSWFMLRYKLRLYLRNLKFSPPQFLTRETEMEMKNNI